MRPPAAVIVAALLCSGVALAQMQWTTVLVQPGRFSVELPAKYRYERNAGVHRYIVEINQRAFVVQAGTYPWNVDVSDPRARLEADLLAAAHDLDDGKWTEVKWTDLPGVEAIGRKDGTVVRSYSRLVDADFVTLTYAGPPQSERNPEVERFIASLRRVR
jgi:hypothetical protein